MVVSRRGRWLTGVGCLVALMKSSSALAQAASGAAAAPAQPAVALPEIVVTAERREQSVQKASLAIQVLSAKDLERSGVTQATDLNSIVPGIQIATGGNAAQIYIRGVGDFAASALSNPAIAVNVDGVYVARPQAINSLFYDLSRIEVLKGPQGTLYGRNASGGAVNLLTNKPSLTGQNGYAEATLGSFGLKQFGGAINLPLSDAVAVRAAVNLLDRNGYLSDGTDDDVRQAGRLRLLWQPNTDTSLMLNADYAHEGGHGPGYVMLPAPAGTGQWTSASSPQANAVLTSTPPVGFLLPPVQANSFRNNQFWNLSAELNQNLGFATLTVLPAFRVAEMSERNYPAGLQNYIPKSVSRETSVEARLANNEGRLKWVIGNYYFNEDQTAQQQINEGLLQDNLGYYYPNTRSYAAFGQGSFSVTDQLRLIAGGRYTLEWRDLTGRILTASPLGLPPGTPLPALLEQFGGNHTFSSTTWKAGAEYDVAPRSMVYFTVSTGFKAGGFNQTVAPDNVYQPETLTAYEVGSKNSFLGNRLQVNLEGFYWKLDDAQIAHVKFDPLGNVNLITDNAGSSTIYGANIDITAKLTHSDQLRLFTEFDQSRYDKFRYNTAYSVFGSRVFNPLSVGCPVGAPFAGQVFGTQQVTVDCSGNEMPRTPKWSGSASYSHTFEFNHGDMVVAELTSQFVSDRWLGYEFVRTQHVDGYAMLDLDLTYRAPGDRWSIGAFGHNVTNAAIYTGGGVQAFAPPLVYATVGPPRTWGVRLRYNFGR